LRDEGSEIPISRPSQAPGDDLVPLEREQVIVDALKNGQRDALAELYSWYGDRLYRRIILPRLPQVEKAEDVLATTFARAAERIEQFTHVDRSIFFWLRRIAINLCLDTHRGHQRDRKLSSALYKDPGASFGSALPAPGAGLEQQEARELIDETLSQLNPRYAQALRLRLLEDRDRQECADLLEVTVGNFDVILHRATKAFRTKYPPK
jgi:RNA polymerase sigma factor (sigma-70 family)